MSLPSTPPSPRAEAAPSRGRLLVVSHPNTVTLNQLVYGCLGDLGWEVHCVIPARWRDSYRGSSYVPEVLPELQERARLLPVALAGAPQRHFYLARVGRIIRAVRPHAAFLEQEPFSVPALQWGSALRRAGIPFCLQAAENLNRPFPIPARVIRRIMLPRARAVAARSPRAAEIVREWGARGVVRVVHHAAPRWTAQPMRVEAPFTIGFAGRLVPEKGIKDLLEAVVLLEGTRRLLVVGDGPLRPRVESAAAAGLTVEVRTGIANTEMPSAYADMDILVLPSRTTERSAEQFGRVLVEALLCGRPVIGSDSGEIPWVIGSTGGGRTFPEGRPDALAAVLAELRDAPEERQRLAARGAEAARRIFGLDAATRSMDEMLLELV